MIAVFLLGFGLGGFFVILVATVFEKIFHGSWFVDDDGGRR